MQFLLCLKQIPSIRPQMRAFTTDQSKCIGPCKATDILHSLISRHEVFTLMLISARNNIRSQIPFDQFSSKSIQDVSHNLSLQSYLSIAMSMRKKKYKEKETFAEAVVKEDAEYPLLYVEKHTLYPERLYLVKNEEFRGFIRKTTRYLSALLSLNDQQFFQLLANNTTIRTCLQSCLATFPRRAYGRLRDSREMSGQTKEITDESYKEYAFLMKLVLFIFYRISSASTSDDKCLVYDQFLLDIPKLLDIAGIYGESNPIIVKRLIQNAYKISPAYDNDTIQFFNSVQHGRIQDLQRNNSTQIDFSPQSLNAQNYGNRQKFMCENVVLTIFMIKDMLFNLINFMRYFPRNYVSQLATDYKIQERLMDGVTYVMHLINNQWKLGAYRQHFQLHFEDLRQTIAVYFIEEFKILKGILDGKEESNKELQEFAHNTYETFCLLLKSKKKPYHREYAKIINNLIEVNEDAVFFMSGHQVFNAVEKTETAVDFCQNYERQYRRKHKIGGVVDFDPILQKNRDNLKKFKQTWLSPEQRNRQQFAKERQMQYKKIQDYELNAYLNSLRYGGKSKEYDDDPEEPQLHQIALPNQYQKLDKNQSIDTSFVTNKKKKYVPKESLPQKNKKDQKDLSFSFKKSANKLHSLSFTQLHQQQIPREEHDMSQISIIVPKEDLFDSISIIGKDIGFEEQQIEQSFREQFDSFIWNNDENEEILQFSKYIQESQKGKNVQIDLSFA